MCICSKPLMADVTQNQPGDSANQDRNDTVLNENIICSHAAKLMGTADSASQCVVGFANFSTHPLMRVGELVEFVSGMI